MRDGTLLKSRCGERVSRSRAFVALALLAVLGAACGKESGNPAPGAGGSSTAGKPGSAGSGPNIAGNGASGAGMATSGASGSGAAEGGETSGGSTAQGGTAAGSTQGGTAGSGEVGGAECQENADCAVLDNCCTCSAVAASGSPQACDRICIQSACAAQGLEDTAAVCLRNRCVFELSCDRSLVTCRVAAPSCPDGTIPSVQGSCWGPCVAASDCNAVTDCDDCAASEACVTNSVFEVTRHCVPVTAECAAEPSCACTNACEYGCNDTDGIGCFCAQC